MVKESIGTLRNVKKWFNNVPPPRPLMHEYTIMKWLAGLTPVFASSSPPRSPHSFTRVCFFTFSLWLLFCFPVGITARDSNICAFVFPPPGWAKRTSGFLYIPGGTSTPSTWHVYIFDCKMIEMEVPLLFCPQNCVWYEHWITPMHRFLLFKPERVTRKSLKAKWLLLSSGPRKTPCGTWRGIGH